MRLPLQALCVALLAVMLLLPTAGCLSLGGGTTYVQEKPDTAARISAIETRVNGLEHAISTLNTSPPVGPPEELQR